MRLLLLMGPETYRATDFMSVALDLPLDLVVGTAAPLALADDFPERYLTLDLEDTGAAVEAVRAFGLPLDVIVAVDDEGVLAAAAISEALELPHNSLAVTRRVRNKLELRRALTDAGLRQPWFTTDVRGVDDFPVVTKPLSLSASRGVIRANDTDELNAALDRVAKISDEVFVEQYMDGDEVALEGVVREGELHVLALFDKPDPLVGPFFEETLYVTPSRHPRELQDAIVEETRRAVAALELRSGPVHAELRFDDRGPWIVEIAPRTIGGLCGRVLKFGAGMSLEELVLREAANLDVPSLDRVSGAAGVMMVPIPQRGVLQAVGGIDRARAVEHVVDVVQTLPNGHEAVPLPEGRRYLGFVFARADAPDAVEAALREAHAHLEIDIRS